MIAAVAVLRFTPVMAGKPEPLDAEFLDYLAACESQDDNWTVVAERRKTRKPAEKPEAAKPASPATGNRREVRP